MRNVILKANSISYYTEDYKCLFRNVSFEYFGGDIICLLGNNGAGKSTLLKVCAGLLQPDLGDISINIANEINSMKISKDSSISWLPQSLTRPQNFNVLEFLSLNRIYFNKNKLLNDKNIVDYEAILSDFNILHLRKRELIDLSGGEWKRVQLARIWAQKSKVVLLDEPDNDLDLSYKQDLIYNCKLFSRKNNSIIFIITHDILFAKEVANKICVLNNSLWVWNSNAELFWSLYVFKKVFGIYKYEFFMNNLNKN